MLTHAIMYVCIPLMAFLAVLELHGNMHVKHLYWGFVCAVTFMCHTVSCYSVFK
jgi:hypothetical protein